MKRKAVSGTILTLLLIGMLTLAFNIQPVKASGTIYIRADGSVDPPGAPISTIDNITYTFTADIYDSIVVERDNIVVDGAGYTLEGPAAEWGIYLSQRENVTIRNVKITGFTYGIYLHTSSTNSISGNNITANEYDGIRLYMSSDYNSISGNQITNNGNGIRLYGIPEDHSDYNRIYGNNITNNEWNGIELGRSSDNILSGNNITNNRDGINLYRSSDNILLGNQITNNGNGITLYNLNSVYNTVSGNNITNNEYGIRILEHTGDNTVSGNNITSNEYGIYVKWSDGNSISGNNLANNNYGIYILEYSGGNTVSGNNIENNNYGIYLRDWVGGNTISGNNITANNSSGICLSGYESGGNTISGNNIENNPIGISLSNTGPVHLNIIYHNNFVNNIQQVDITTPGYANIWDDGYPSGGNYWSDYTDVDQYSGPYQDEPGSDGIWDHPYVIDENNQDNYPLTNPLAMGVHDIAVINVALSKTVVNQNDSLNINVTVANQGNFTETFNVTLYAEPTLVGYWTFDEASGTTAYDSSGNNNNGTISGATWTSGKIGSALQFDGTDDYVEVPHSASLNLTNTGTIAAWIKIPSIGAVNRGNIISKGGGWNRRGWMLTTVGYNKIRFHWQSAADKFIDSQTTLTYDEWHHVAAVMNGTMMKIYIDGVQDPNTLLNTESADTTNPIRIGRTDYYGNLPFNGTIDEARVYNIALREEEIRTLATTGRTAIQTQTITLESSTSTTITFTWNTTGFALGNYTISAYAWPVLGETDIVDNLYVDGQVLVLSLFIHTDKYTYHAGDTMYLGLNLTNPDGERNVCFAVWVVRPNGSVYLYIHRHNITLPANFTYSNPAFRTITLPTLSPGPFVWHAALLDPSTHEIRVEDTAEWEFV